MPDQTDPPKVRPIVKLRNVSMREGPPGLLPHRSIKRAPGSWVTPQAPPLPERAADQAGTRTPADRAVIPPAAGDADRPIFTHQYTRRPAEPVQREANELTILPRTRYRPAAALIEGAEPDVPPTPALALRLAQRQSSSRPGGTAFATPSRLLDQAVRQRLWDPFAFHRRKPPPAG